MPEPILIVASLNERLEPLDRGEYYEDPLSEALAGKNLGEVVGGGTLTSKDRQIEHCDIEVETTDKERAIPFIIEFLELQGAPKGSTLHVAGEKLPFGKYEGIAIYLDGVNLPDSVYETCDINFVIEEINRILGPKGRFRGHWQGNTETGLYMYGASAEKMRTALQDFLNTYPLCKGARVEAITPTAEPPPSS